MDPSYVQFNKHTWKAQMCIVYTLLTYFMIDSEINNVLLFNMHAQGDLPGLQTWNIHFLTFFFVHHV